MELVISTGIITVVTLGTSAIVQNDLRARNQAESQKSTVGELNTLQNALKNNTNLTGACRDFVSTATSTVNLTGQTPLRIQLNNTMYADNTELFSGGSRFRIDRLYLDSPRAVSNASAAERIFTSVAQVEASLQNGRDWMPIPRRSIGSFSIKLDASNAMIDCTPVGFTDMNETICRSISGMRWLPGSEECLQDIELDGNNDFAACPGGTQRSQNGVCVPTGSACFSQFLPQAFGRGVVDTCNRVPATYAVAYPSGFTPLPEPPPPPGGGPGNSSSMCSCGSHTISPGTNLYCVSCDREANARPFGESDYYYTVESCGAGGELQRIPGPDRDFEFKDQSDPPSNGKCERQRGPGSYNGNGRVVQFRNP